MRSRVVVALLLPVVLFLFLIGWVLHWVGKQTDAKKSPQKQLNAGEDANATEDNVETGLIDELTEEQLTAE